MSLNEAVDPVDNDRNFFVVRLTGEKSSSIAWLEFGDEHRSSLFNPCQLYSFLASYSLTFTTVAARALSSNTIHEG